LDPKVYEPKNLCLGGALADDLGNTTKGRDVSKGSAGKSEASCEKKGSKEL
jgi:hypothetical protein